MTNTTEDFIQNAINVQRREFVEELINYEDFGFESAESMLEGVEIDDEKDNAIYYQGYLEGMKDVKALIGKYDQGLLLEIAYLVGQLGVKTDVDVSYDWMKVLYEQIYKKADENKMGGLLQNIYDLFDQGEAKKIIEEFYRVHGEMLPHYFDTSLLSSKTNANTLTN